ncbi:hypothetical protein Patl1_37668 [Pistacia atlantica]|nr:hypothetical protein Patl1_37668 [Pistacia atlantica]
MLRCGSWVSNHISQWKLTILFQVTLEYYLNLQMKPKDGKEARQRSQSQDQWVQGVLKEESHGSSFLDRSKRFSSLQNPVTNPNLYSTIDTSKNLSYSYWFKVCLNNIAKLAKEATTMRHVLEPLFHHFDVENHWSSDTGVACCVILYL